MLPLRNKIYAASESERTLYLTYHEGMMQICTLSVFMNKLPNTLDMDPVRLIFFIVHFI